MGSRQFYAILFTKNWSSSDPDPKLTIRDRADPDPANNFGSGSTTLTVRGILEEMLRPPPPIETKPKST